MQSAKHSRWNGGTLYASQTFGIPCSSLDMVPRFARPVPVLSMITNEVLDHVYRTHQHRICQWYPEVMNPLALQRYADAVANKGAPLQNCFGYIDGIVRAIARPDTNQWILYNGHSLQRGFMRSNFNQLLYQICTAPLVRGYFSLPLVCSMSMPSGPNSRQHDNVTFRLSPTDYELKF